MNPNKDVLLWDAKRWDWTVAAIERLTHVQRDAVRQLVYATYWEPRVLAGQIEHTVYQTFQNNVYMVRRS